MVRMKGINPVQERRPVKYVALPIRTFAIRCRTNEPEYSVIMYVRDVRRR